MNPDTIANIINLGAAGAVVVVVVIFLRFIKERDRIWQSFFTQSRQADKENSQRQTTVLESLVECIRNLDHKFDEHDAVEMEVLHNLLDKQSPKRRKSEGTG